MLVQGKARYSGIDTPETVHPTNRVEYFGKEASEKNGELVEGKTVFLEKDVSEIDKHGRLLRYVWIDEVVVNAELVRLGYAQAVTYPSDVKYQEYFLQPQKAVQEASHHWWHQRRGHPSFLLLDSSFRYLVYLHSIKLRCLCYLKVLI